MKITIIANLYKNQSMGDMILPFQEVTYGACSTLGDRNLVDLSVKEEVKA